MRWIVSFPCWGEDFCSRACAPIKSILLALRCAGIPDALVIINTDQPRAFDQLGRFGVRLYSLPTDIKPEDRHFVFGQCHQQAIDLAEPGDRIAFMCGDMAVSLDSFAAAERIFAGGKKLIMCAASPTVGEAPIMTSAALLDWSLDNLAPMARDLFWKEGRGAFPWCVYFRHARGVDFRGFHIHPFAAVKHAGLSFQGTTVDFDLSEQFSTRDVHVVTSPDELAVVARVSGDGTLPRVCFKVRTSTVVRTWASGMGKFATPRHLWHFSNQITLKGEPDPANKAIADKIIRRIEQRWAAQGTRRTWRDELHGKLQPTA
jgi:hypothetical protein